MVRDQSPINVGREIFQMGQHTDKCDQTKQLDPMLEH